ncbi:MAG: GreA/GreB family elongation factor [Actinomycetota bacterium]|jgi:transcription elongation GreA/GreB family factor|nr:GreA/GreB family elongation factor [Actinomycetota bacterium]
MADTSNAIARTRQRLEEELTQLQARRKALADELGGRDTVGDRADHADLLEQADDLAWLDDRIAEITGLLARGGVPEPAAGRLPHGAEVTLRFDDGDVSTLRVVAIPEEATEDDAGAVTLDSPLGRALVGSKVGDIVQYGTPSGPALVEVLALRMPEE